jgi:periplasmic protein TonB
MRFTLSLRWKGCEGGDAPESRFFFRRPGFLFLRHMKFRIRNKMEIWNLKTAAFISVAFHLVLLFASSTLFSNASARQKPIRIVNVALYPLVNQNESLPESNPAHPVKNHSRKDEIKESVREQKRTEPPLQKEITLPIPLPVKVEERKIPAEATKPIPPPREEEVPAESPPVITIAAPGSDPTPTKEELPPLPFPSSSSGGAQESNLSNLPVKEGEGMGQGGSNGGGSGNGVEAGAGGPRWRGTGDGSGSRSGQGGASVGGSGNGSGTGSGSGRRDGSGGGSQKGLGLFAKLFSSSGGSAGAHPKYAENPKPPYPREARDRGYHGEVLLRVEVLSNGRVGQIEVRRSSGYEMLDHSALSTVKQWKFIPAKRGEDAVSLWVNIPVKFQLQ